MDALLRKCRIALRNRYSRSTRRYIWRIYKACSLTMLVFAFYLTTSGFGNVHVNVSTTAFISGFALIKFYKARGDVVCNYVLLELVGALWGQQLSPDVYDMIKGNPIWRVFVAVLLSVIGFVSITMHALLEPTIIYSPSSLSLVATLLMMCCTCLFNYNPNATLLDESQVKMIMMLIAFCIYYNNQSIIQPRARRISGPVFHAAVLFIDAMCFFKCALKILRK